MSDLMGILDSCLFGSGEGATDPALSSVVIDDGEGGGGGNGASKDLLSASLAQSGILDDAVGDGVKSWETESDELLDSILTGNSDAEKLGCLGLEKPFSDTSSDSSGCTFEQQMLSPVEGSTTAGNPSSNIDLIDFINDSDEDQTLEAVNPVTISGDDDDAVSTLTTTITIPPQQTPPKKTVASSSPITLATSGHVQNAVIQTGSTTIVLPVITTNRNGKQSLAIAPPTKRRRVSQSSSDSGLDDNASYTASSIKLEDGKYPALLLNEEEKRLCEREGIKLPSHYPLSREEEKNLKRIRRKIRNKVSAQDSRKRKKEYVDAMEDRVRRCSVENDELHKKIELLETQNKTLAGQLRRLHQIIVNGGLRQTQTSTAMMVLLLSTALFLIPGFKESQDTKCDLDITQAIKMPPMPGQSRSLLHFTPTTQIKREIDAVNVDAIKQEKADSVDGGDVVTTVTQVVDHDYFVGYSAPSTAPSGPTPAKRAKISILTPSQNKPFVVKEEGKADVVMMDGNDIGGESYIEEDAPAQGYGPGKVEERRVNVTTGHMGATRTIVLHVPKDIK